ncbi:hypothetical protein F5B21DRAFT_78043 [Xylaria acuta]|nr:hypothetical protein F5B21DRAFT_78043 [Xylaria acuta]
MDKVCISVRRAETEHGPVRKWKPLHLPEWQPLKILVCNYFPNPVVSLTCTRVSKAESSTRTYPVFEHGPVVGSPQTLRRLGNFRGRTSTQRSPKGTRFVGYLKAMRCRPGPASDLLHERGLSWRVSAILLSLPRENVSKRICRSSMQGVQRRNKGKPVVLLIIPDLSLRPEGSDTWFYIGCRANNNGTDVCTDWTNLLLLTYVVLFTKHSIHFPLPPTMPRYQKGNSTLTDPDRPHCW